jgi:hypothetical protein
VLAEVALLPRAERRLVERVFGLDGEQPEELELVAAELRMPLRTARLAFGRAVRRFRASGFLAGAAETLLPRVADERIEGPRLAMSRVFSKGRELA